VQQAQNTGDGIRLLANGSDSALLTRYLSSIDAWQITASYGSTGAYKPITWFTSDTERMRLDSSGNLGLGVTPSAWYGYMKAMQISDIGSYVSSYTSGITSYQHTFLGNNGYMNSSANWIYSKSRPAAQYYQNDNTHQWLIAPSGTAGNAITFTQAMTLDASSNLLLNSTTNSNSAKMKIGGGARTVKFFDLEAQGGENWIIDSTNTSGSTDVLGIYAAGTTGMYLTDTGNLLVGTTSIPAWGDTTGFGFGYDLPNKTVHFKNNVSTSNALTYFNATSFTSGTGYFAQFRVNGSTVGNITTNGSTTSYTSISDYRLKENIQPIISALSKVIALKPVTYTWKSTGESDEGFIAHELQEVCPSAVSGEKDAVDVNGNPVYQGIDTSFLVATLTAAIQEQQALINSLTARLDAANL
jgi:hypothetical protein